LRLALSTRLRAFLNPQPPAQKFLTLDDLLLGNTYGIDPSSHNLTLSDYGASQAYLSIIPIKTSVDLIADQVSTITRTVIDRKTGETVYSSADNAPDYGILGAIDKAYGDYGAPLLQLWVQSLLIQGVAFIEIVRDKWGYPIRLKWYNPNSMQVYAPRGEIEHFTYSGVRGTETFTPQEMIYQRMFNPMDDIAGFSPTLNAMAKANVELSFDKYTLAYYMNAGQPGIMITPKDGNNRWQPEAIKQYQMLMRQSLKGVQNFFRTLVIGEPVEMTAFEPVDISKPLEVTKHAEEVIYQSYRVPPKIVGKEGAYQFDAETKLAFMQLAVKPYCVKIAELINSQLIRLFENPFHVFQFDMSEYEIVADADLKRQQLAELQYRSGIITWREYRAKVKEDVDVLPESRDFFLMPDGSYKPVGQLGRMNTPATVQPNLLSFGELESVADKYHAPLETVLSLYHQYMQGGYATPI